MKNSRQILCVVLALVLCLGLCTPALAYGDTGKPGEYTVISAGSNHTAAVDANGVLWTWGSNGSGQLGNGTTENSSVPVKVMDNVAAVSCGNSHTAAIKTDGTLWVWGQGPMGNGTPEGSMVPVKVMSGVAAVSCGGGFTAAIKTDGTLWTWGNNDDGQLGIGNTNSVILPQKVMEDVTAVSCGGNNIAAIKRDGTLWVAGDDYYGQAGGSGYLGTNWSVKRVTSFTRISLSDVVAVTCGDYHIAAVTSSGSLYIWGNNSNGELGTGGHGNQYSNLYSYYDYQTTPRYVMDDVAAVSCGSGYCAVIKKDGTLYTWGAGSNGRLGNGGTSTANTPVAVMYDAAVVACGSSSTRAIKTDGTLWTWGNNGSGQLGNGESDTYTTYPIQISKPSMALPVRLELNGGTGTTVLWVKSGETLTVPTNPTKEGYTFGGWYTDEGLTKPFNFNNVVTEGFTLYAKWVPVSSNAESTGRSNQIITLNGNTITLDAYRLITDNGGEVTYVKLRDIAVLLENTGAQFNVDWRNGAIYVSTGTPYTTKNGTELKPIPGTDGSYKWNTAPVLINGVTTTLEGIVITDGNDGDHTFFKIRDLGAALGFLVDWSPERGIFIETN